MNNEVPNASRGPRELLHFAMAEILSRPDWWSLPENQAAGIAQKAVHGALPINRIIEEFRELRRERGLPAVRE